MITHEKNSEVSVDVHHHVPSLYILVSALVNEKLENGEDFCTFDLCKDAIELHFQNKIGYVTLLKSMHEKFHNGRLDIPASFIKGDYRHFMNTYSKFLDEYDLESMEERIVVSESNCSWTRDNYQTAMEA